MEEDTFQLSDRDAGLPAKENSSLSNPRRRERRCPYSLRQRESE